MTTASDLLSVVVGFDDGPQDVTEFMQSGTIRRGRSRMVGDFDPGTSTIVLHNEQRRLDPEFPGLDPGAWGQVRPGLSVDVFYDTSTQLFGGHLKPTGHDYTDKGAPSATLTAQDALAALAQRRFAEWQTVPGQRAGARMTAALARSEVDWSGSTSFDIGVMLLGGDLATSGQVVRDYFRLLARTEAGRFFASRDNTLTFRQVNRASTAAVVAEFTDDPTDHTKILMWTPVVSYGDQWYTQVNATRAGGVKQTRSSDSTIRDLHGGGFLPLDLDGLLMSDDFMTANLCGYLLALHETLVSSITQLRVEMDALDPTDAATVAGLEINDLVAPTWTPPGADESTTQTLAIEGISDSWSQTQPWVRTLTLSRAIGAQGWVVGDATLGQVGIGVSGL